MIMKALGLLLVGLVVVVSARTYDEELAKNEALVGQLNQWLEDNVHGDDLTGSPEQNVEEAKKAPEAHPELQPIVDALVTISSAKDCSESVLDALRVLYPVSVVISDRRIDFVARHYMQKLPTKACLNALQSQYKQVADFKDPKIAGLIKRFADDARHLFDRASMQDYLLNQYLSAEGPEEKAAPSDIHWFKLETASAARVQGKDDPKANIYEQVKDEETGHMLDKFHPENFKYSFETYLRKPCQEFMGKTESIFEAFFSVAKHLTNPTYSSEYKDQVKYTLHFPYGYGRTKKGERILDFYHASYYTSKEFQDGLATYKRCRLLEKYDDEKIKESYDWAQYSNPDRRH